MILFSFFPNCSPRSLLGLGFCAVLLLSGCTGGLHVDKAAKLPKLKKDQEIVSIDPEYFIKPTTAAVGKQTATQVSMQTAQSGRSFNEILRNNAKKVGINLKIIESSTLTPYDEDYFNALAPLKRDIIQAVFLQHFGDNAHRSNRGFSNGKKFVVETWQQCPFIPARYCHLAQRYQTRYFAVQGIRFERKSSPVNTLNIITVPPVGLLDLLDPDLEAYYYNIVADVVSSQIVYKEVRSVETKDSKSDLNSLIYDSFKMLGQR
jgi:hypothetical protein